MDYTKKDLEKKFGLSDNTVYKILKVCGLNTGKQKYQEGEIEERFVPAHNMLKEGKTYKQIEEYFANKEQAEYYKELGNLGEQDTEDFDHQDFAASQTEGTSNTISILAAQNLADMVDEAVSEVLPYLPAMVAQAINNQLNSLEVGEGLKNMREEVKKKRGSGVAFLLHKMQKAQVTQMREQKNLMSGTGEQKQLPQSVPNSLDNP